MATHNLTLPGHGQLDVTVDAHGAGHPFLLLHGGAGPQSVAGFARTLAERNHARVIVPTHPGFDGTHRPQWLTTIAGLAQLYRALLDDLDLVDVTVFGSSIGGWIAAELALLQSQRISSTILVDAVGIDVAGQPVADIFSLTLAELAERSYHNPESFRIDPASLSDAQRAAMAANRATLRTYGGTMTDPTLRPRLAAISLPTLVVWGDSDGICTPDYGRAYAAAIPGARFALLPNAGHLPQIEAPEPLRKLVWDFAHTHADHRSAAR
ncbi:alpha/beta fold hydrolase [Sorangium sp. So ce381]|uniref:alpha/beta fold hydrolase n=1 Tax=Sorangium sp. So ce381 TaxID=3133307 RepID=UPI003F5B2D6B